VHEGVLQVRTVQLNVHTDKFISPERGLLSALDSSQEGADAVESVGDGQRDQSDVSGPFHRRGVHRRLHSAARQHHHVEDVAEKPEHAQRRVDDSGKRVLDRFE